MNSFSDDEGQNPFQMKFMITYQFHSGGVKERQGPARRLQNHSWAAVFSDQRDSSFLFLHFSLIFLSIL